MTDDIPSIGDSQGRARLVRKGGETELRVERAEQPRQIAHPGPILWRCEFFPISSSPAPSRNTRDEKRKRKKKKERREKKHRKKEEKEADGKEEMGGEMLTN